MYDILFFASLIAGWIVLNVWILPLFGIRTCMSGACQASRVKHVEPQRSKHNAVNEY
jgi:hypothetical protein